MSKLKIKQVRSIVGRPWKHRLVIQSLGLRHHQMTVIHDDTPAIRGMVQKVRHLVEVEEVK
jgi:large subunit ribosomal protein L30